MRNEIIAELKAEGIADVTCWASAQQVYVTHEQAGRTTAHLAKWALHGVHLSHLWQQCHFAAKDLWGSDPVAAGMAYASEAARCRGWMDAAASIRLPLQKREPSSPDAIQLAPGGHLAEAFTHLGTSEWHDGQPAVPHVAPHKVGKWTWSVWRRANQILRPYGWSVSRAAIAAMLNGIARADRTGLPGVGRTAVRVAAASLPAMFGGGTSDGTTSGVPWWYRGHLPTLRQARAVLVAARGWGQRDQLPVAVKTAASAVCRGDNVDWLTAVAEAQAVNLGAQSPDDKYVAGAPILDDAGYIVGRAIFASHGIVVQRCWLLMWDELGPRPEIADSVRVEGPNGRSYHAKTWDPHYAIRQALAAWGKQRKLEREQSSLAERLADLSARLNGATPIAFYQDSYAAGNCYGGTLHWATLHGFHNACPLEALLHAPEQRARNVLAFVLGEMEATV